MKTAASANHVDPTRIGTHSLRSGGANAMFVAGYDTEIIKRWGEMEIRHFYFLSLECR